ncbi:hypothetical protein B0O99DRAFT_685632 [Bisporella sp. PMI_857]|nr:hypothetical protein B0O99DRAFT_685632 [Bisporella sp. PMI_857]
MEKLSLADAITHAKPSEKQENIAPQRASNDAPPNYSVTDPIADADDAAAAEMNAAFANLSIPDVPSEFPTVDHCLAHLKLLNAIHSLKEDVGYTDGLFGLWDSRVEKSALDDQKRDQALAKTREKRWALYVARAAERFQEWWVKVLCPRENGRRIQTKELIDESLDLTQFTIRGRVQVWTTAMLPPLDVLMVWHAFMLNPRNYLEDCIRFSLKNLWATGMPWQAVNAAINTNFSYTVPDGGIADFMAKTGHCWNNADDPLTKSIHCPRCSQALEIPWTTCSEDKTTHLLQITELNGSGYGDRGLVQICSGCGGRLDHDLLRVAKFKKDTENLLSKDWPLGGTILDPRTGTAAAPTRADWFRYPNLFPNRLIKMQLRGQILDLIAPGSVNNPSMNDVRGLIEQAILNRSVIKKLNNLTVRDAGVLQRAERLSIRKMMSRYWENTSIFALELGGAVIRQNIFVDKMHNLDWLHSPAARNTMDRLLEKYSRFITIIAENPKCTAVPTLDVDLAWHTHQLSPAAYYGYTIQQCDKFIDHDDKIEEDALSTAFEWTSKIYEKMFQQVYSECTCWYCEAIRVRHSSNTGKILGTSKHEKVSNDFYSSGAANLCPPNNSAHISSHNAVHAKQSAIKAATFERLRRRRQMELDDAYKKACKRAEKKGRKPPSRDECYYGAWGYPYMMYGPYMAMPMYGGAYYAGDPCTMNTGTGMHGACAVGTCSGGVAAGGCGGPGGCGGGGCSNAASGGCGGGGCGGGGCGGGGGGCGGGGGS